MQSKITKHAKGEDHITENQDPQMIQILKLWKKDFEMSMINKEKKRKKMNKIERCKIHQSLEIYAI